MGGRGHGGAVFRRAPAAVASPGARILRIDCQDPDDRLEDISWDDWFEKFDEAKLAFLYQDEKKDGETSTFFKLVKR